MNAVMLIDLLIALGKGVLAVATQQKWPAELLTAVQAGVDKLSSVYNDPVTKAQLESLRG